MGQGDAVEQFLVAFLADVDLIRGGKFTQDVFKLLAVGHAVVELG